MPPDNTNYTNAAAANITSSAVGLFQDLDSVESSYNEDCLTLNVWTKPQTGDAKKAVLLWIYGGAFKDGTSATPGYSGANIADQEDVVVVSIK